MDTPTASLTVIHQHIQELVRFTRAEQPLLLVVGAAKSGSQTLLNALVDKSKDSRNIVRVPASQIHHPPNLAKLLAKSWHIKLNYRHDTLENQLHDILLNLAKREQACLLIIEDAHSLPLAVMAALSHLAILQDGIKTQLHIILSGQPALLQKMQSLQFLPVPHLCLDSLPHDKACETIRDSLREADIKPESDTLDNLVEHIYTKSNGIPSSINSMVSKLEEQKPYLEEMPEQTPLELLWQRIKKTSFNSVRVMSIVGLCLVGFVYYQFNRDNFFTVPAPHMGNSKQASNMLYAAASQTHPKTALHLAQYAKQPYTIQLISSTSEKKTDQFIRDHHLTEQVEKVFTRQHNQDRYELIYGHYASVKDAKQARDHLPTDLKKLKPWIKRL